MSQRIYRSHQEPIREKTTWDECWRGDDQGLITVWEVGRKMRDSEVAERAAKDELPVMGWKGGVERKIKQDVKYGTLLYLAQWQGIRGEDLDVDLTGERELVCARTGMRVIFTSDASKYGNSIAQD